MNGWSVAAVVAVAASFGGMAAVSAGYVSEPSFASPVWYLLVTAVVGYWIVFVRWARTT
jgi:hypothetical protein